MTKDISIEEGNRLVRNFVGDGHSSIRYNYHDDWNALMRACKKWDCLDVSWMPDSEPYGYMALCDALDNAVTNYEILPVRRQLVECIHSLVQRTEKAAVKN